MTPVRTEITPGRTGQLREDQWMEGRDAASTESTFDIVWATLRGES